MQVHPHQAGVQAEVVREGDGHQDEDPTVAAADVGVAPVPGAVAEAGHRDVAPAEGARPEEDPPHQDGGRVLVVAAGALAAVLPNLRHRAAEDDAVGDDVSPLRKDVRAALQAAEATVGNAARADVRAAAVGAVRAIVRRGRG